MRTDILGKGIFSSILGIALLVMTVEVIVFVL